MALPSTRDESQSDAEVSQAAREKPAKLEDVLFVATATRRHMCSKYAVLLGRAGRHLGGLEGPGDSEETQEGNT